LGAFGEGGGQNMWVTVPLVSGSDEPGVKDFAARIRKNAGDDVVISHYVMTHYNSMMAMKAALEKTGKVDRESLVDGLEGLTIKSPTGDVSIGADHHVTMNMYLAKTEGAGLKTVDALGALAPEASCG
ncbi:MAG: ABC transporter substrate-binding protein, partial [Proteobacteria bacterium]|nr:ABC transporter substrate-binding protein [Pseudomonadota bacterium]